MTLEEWIEKNVRPNVLSVGNIQSYPPEGDTTLYDIGVFVTTSATTVNRSTQPVYKIGNEFHFGRNVVKNWEEPAPVAPTKDEKLQAALEQIKTADPNAKYVGMDTSSDLTVVKIEVGGVVRGFSFIGDNLNDIEVKV